MVKLFATKKKEKILDFSSSWYYLCDQKGVPCDGEIFFEDEYIVINSPENKFFLNLLYEIEGFGKVMVRTELLSLKKNTYHLNDVLINGRIKEISGLISRLKKESIPVSNTWLKDFYNAQKKRNYSQLMNLGEILSLKSARYLLRLKIINGRMKSFKFGGQAFGLIEHGDAYKKRFVSFYDYATAPFYFFLTRPQRNKTDWKFTDKIVDWLSSENIPIKGHPLVWFHQAALPEWMKLLSYEELKHFIQQHVRETVLRYKNRIHIWDITNEFPTIDANALNLSINQLLELLSIISKEVKRIQPEAYRIINISDIFGSKSYIHDIPSVPPVYFLRLAKKRGIEFEAVGLQFYTGMRKEFACREFLDIGRQLDEYVSLGKDLHLTECEIPSRHDVDPECFFSADHPEVAGKWHKPWSEKIQSEYLKNLLITFSSKPKAKAFTWWTFTDKGVHHDIGSRFIPFGGLLRRDLSPKPSYIMLNNFKNEIRQTKE